MGDTKQKLEALGRWDRFCKENGFDYFAAGGLATAVRGAAETDQLTNADWKIGMLTSAYKKAMRLIQKSGLEKEFEGLKVKPFDNLPETYNNSRLYTKLVRESSWKRFGAKRLASAALRRGYNLNKNASRVWGVVYKKREIIDMNRLFPTVPTAFEGMSVNMPADPYIWHAAKDDDYLAHVTAERVKVLKAFDAICAEQKLEYFAVAFLLIAAVVYHDFVPGTEGRNFDVGMRREDFEAFCGYMREQGSSHGIVLREYEDDKKRMPLANKILSLAGNENTEYVIRILPFDKVPEDPYMYEGFMEDMEKYNKQAKAGKGRLKNTEDADRFAQTFNGDERTDRYRRIALGESKTIRGEQLFPLRRARLLDVEICVPRDYSVWQPVQDEALEFQTKSIQKDCLYMLEALDKAARELGIGYFVCGGTMLGYARHGGFIPWDDDIDVGMLRADYERFIREAGSVLGDDFFLQTRETDPNIPYLYSKLRLNGTEYMTEYTSKRDMHQGIGVDLFPFDYLPDEPDKCKPFIKEVERLAGAHIRTARYHTREVEGLVEPRTDLEKRYHREQKEKFDALRATDLAQTQEAYLEAAERFNEAAENAPDPVAASFVPSFTYIHRSDLLPYRRVKFENIEVSVPAKPEVFLKMQYGDFMKMPPQHARTAHRLVRWATRAEKPGENR